MTRRAISPRLAMRTLEIIGSGSGADREELLAVLDRLAVLRIDLDDRPVGVRLDLVPQLHRLEDAEDLPFRDAVADVHERLGFGVRRTVERADDRRLDDVETGVRVFLRF